MRIYDYEKEERLRKKAVMRRLLPRFAVVVFGILVLIMAASLGSRMIRPRFDSNQTVDAMKEIDFHFRAPDNGEKVDSLTDYQENYAVGIQYPTAKDEQVNQKVVGYVQSMADEFSREMEDYQPASPGDRAVMSADYQSWLIEERYLCIVFYLTKQIPEQTEEQHWTQSQIIDLEEVGFLTVEDLFDDELLERLPGLIYEYADETLAAVLNSGEYQDYLGEDWHNYRYISFDAEKGTVSFHLRELSLDSGSGPLACTIPIDEVYDQLKKNITGHLKNESVNVPVIPPTVDVDPSRPMIALTYDDGPYPEVTNRILDVLETNGGRATFFVVGDRAEKYQETMRRAHDLGNQIGNHSYDHASLAKLSEEEVSSQVNTTNRYIAEVTGNEHSMLRPPYGAINDTVKQFAGAPVITWSLDTLDYRIKNGEEIAQKLLDSVKDGDIVLMHDLYDFTAEASELFIPALIEQGYQLVTVEELLVSRNKEVEPGVIYNSATVKSQ